MSSAAENGSHSPLLFRRSLAQWRLIRDGWATAATTKYDNAKIDTCRPNVQSRAFSRGVIRMLTEVQGRFSRIPEFQSRDNFVPQGPQSRSSGLVKECRITSLLLQRWWYHQDPRISRNPMVNQNRTMTCGASIGAFFRSLTAS